MLPNDNWINYSINGEDAGVWYLEHRSLCWVPGWIEAIATWSRTMSSRIITLMTKANPESNLCSPVSHMSKWWDNVHYQPQRRRRVGSAGSALSASLNSLQGSDKMTSNYIFRPNLESPQVWEELLFECLSSQPPPPHICWTHYTINRGFLNIKGDTGFVSCTLRSPDWKWNFHWKVQERTNTEHIISSNWKIWKSGSVVAC